MRTIKRQVVASTAVDLQGDKLTKEQLRHLFEQMPQEQILNQHHDFAKPPVGRLYNKQFVERPNGEAEIVIDVDLYDEEAFAEMEGFSISYVADRLTIDKSRKPDIQILFNPIVFDKKDILPLIELSDESLQIEAIEIKQKGLLVPSAILVLKFTGLTIAAGFLGEAGADVYRALKAGLRQLADKRMAREEPEPTYQLHFTAITAKRPVDVIVELLPQDLDATNHPEISVDSALEYIKTTVGDSEIQRVVLRVQRSAPYWRVIYFMDSKGNVVQL